MNEDWNPVPAPNATLEHPATGTAPDKSPEKQDTLNSPGSFLSQSLTQLARQLHEAPEQTDAWQQRLHALRSSPGFGLIGHSTLLLKACQMDMDYPPRLRDYVREQLTILLQRTTGKFLSPDTLSIRFKTDTHPEVNGQGRERYSRRMTLTEIGVLSFNHTAIHTLMQHSFADKPLDASSPTLTSSVALELILKANWSVDYTALMEHFWNIHRHTYRALAKLSFLDELARHYAEKRLSREGYFLALDALGLKVFPTADLCLHKPVRGVRACASMLTINGQVIPEAVQLRSKNTSHCFIHLPGSDMAPVEYISDDPQRMTQKLIDTLTAAHAFTAFPDTGHTPTGSPSPHLSMIAGDVLSEVTYAEEKRCHDHLEKHFGSGGQPNPFKTIKRSIALLSAVDIWQTQPDILQHLPNASTHAATVMGKLLRQRYNQDLNPDKVFIRYLRGQSIRPLGSARQPGTYVQVPDEYPISLSEALVRNYRVESAAGYIDQGASNVVYYDPTGKGQWSADQQLSIDPQAIENDIRGVDFLQHMTEHINAFWEQHSVSIETSLQRNFMTQALLCAKQGALRRTGFDLVITALDELNNKAAGVPVQWSVPGFFLQHSVIEGSKAQYCPSLLVLSHAESPRRVLYQAGMIKAFAEFDSENELDRYLWQAARSQAWRQSVLHYAPERHHDRLTYIFKIWSGEQAPNPPVSLLRPWTDHLYNHDAHQASARKRDEQRLTVSPFIYIRRMLQQNSLWNAQDTIVTSREISLRYWTRQFSQLQFLLAPMSVLLTPALIASLAAELGIAALNTSSANLPGARYDEKRQAMLTVLSLGLLHLAPSTPRLASALRKWLAPVKPALRVAHVAKSITPAAGKPKNFGMWLNQSMRVRNTRLEKFFHTDAQLKSWTIAGHPDFATRAVKVWKLQRQFLLWTAQTRQARTLVVSSHGYYLPWSKSAAIPNGTELHVYAPHGHVLVDPMLHRVASKKIAPFAILDTQRNATVRASMPPYVMTDKLLAGTSREGMIKNYSLSKFQSPYYESYQDISHIVRNSNQSAFLSTLPPSPMDVLTIRSRFGLPHPTLEQLFETLAETGIHYDQILLLHCRCPLFKALAGTAPVYQAT